MASWDGIGCVQMEGKLLLDYTGQTEGLFQSGPGGPGPMSKRGQLEREAEEAVIRVHPSSGMGTRSHSLTRHKAGCVCERGRGPREGF